MTGLGNLKRNPRNNLRNQAWLLPKGPGESQCPTRKRGRLMTDLHSTHVTRPLKEPQIVFRHLWICVAVRFGRGVESKNIP